MLNDISKLAMWDELLETNNQLRDAYDEQVTLIENMSKAIYQAKQALDSANAVLLAWVDLPDEEIKQKPAIKPRRKA